MCIPWAGHCILEMDILTVDIRIVQNTSWRYTPAEGSVEALTQWPSSSPSLLAPFLNERNSLRPHELVHPKSRPNHSPFDFPATSKIGLLL